MATSLREDSSDMLSSIFRTEMAPDPKTGSSSQPIDLTEEEVEGHITSSIPAAPSNKTLNIPKEDHQHRNSEPSTNEHISSNLDEGASRSPQRTLEEAHVLATSSLQGPCSVITTNETIPLSMRLIASDSVSSDPDASKPSRQREIGASLLIGFSTQPEHPRLCVIGAPQEPLSPRLPNDEVQSMIDSDFSNRGCELNQERSSSKDDNQGFQRCIALTLPREVVKDDQSVSHSINDLLSSATASSLVQLPLPGQFSADNPQMISMLGSTLTDVAAGKIRGGALSDALELLFGPNEGVSLAARDEAMFLGWKSGWPVPTPGDDKIELTELVECFGLQDWLEEECGLEQEHENESVCDVCHNDDDDRILFLCDNCPRAFHAECLDDEPPSKEEFEEEETWLCPYCVSEDFIDDEDDEDKNVAKVLEIFRPMRDARLESCREEKAEQHRKKVERERKKAAKGNMEGFLEVAAVRGPHVSHAGIDVTPQVLSVTKDSEVRFTKAFRRIVAESDQSYENVTQELERQGRFVTKSLALREASVLAALTAKANEENKDAEMVGRKRRRKLGKMSTDKVASNPNGTSTTTMTVEDVESSSHNTDEIEDTDESTEGE